MELPAVKQEKIKLTEINQYLTCYLCKGYLIDATTISECLHSFCRSCIIKFLQDNSYCPVCELIINKAKPNLKLDKTLQDIVYKLVPELFLKEMLRRKTFYKDHPDIVARVSPEERGEDTERTIFNPQELISLSLEYICDDSTPGAIRIPGITIDPETLKANGTSEEGPESQMKRYLLCPGMCRIEVLKKFVRNKYNVDTSQFFIDVLYKRVPLPGHYTLIDIAYIYSWQRNELMKFFFRIIDINKAKSAESPDIFVPQFIPRPVRRSKSRKEVGSAKKLQRKSKANTDVISHEILADIRKPEDACDNVEKEDAKAQDPLNGAFDFKMEKSNIKIEGAVKADSERAVSKADKENTVVKEGNNKEKSNGLYLPIETIPSIKKELLSPCSETSPDSKVLVKKIIDTSQISAPITKSYTSITLNRSENVEIITQISPVSTKDGTQIEHHIIKQTIKKGSKMKSPKKVTPRLVLTKKNAKKKSPKRESACNGRASEMAGPSNVVVPPINLVNPEVVPGDEKSVFFNYINLVPNHNSESIKQENSIEIKQEVKSPDMLTQQVILSRPNLPQKRKGSPKSVKAKVPKLQPKKPVKIILQEKPPATVSTPQNVKAEKGLQSLISTCKIPSSLSITIKESSDKDSLPPVAPPVKNYIEILKLPEETTDRNKTQSEEVVEHPKKLDVGKFCDNDSEQKVDEDLAEIAKSLTEKIPMSTTISQLVGPKSQFQIPIAPKPQIQPAPVPELPTKLVTATPSGKLSPRQPQTFQKIFEESLKKPFDGLKSSAMEVSTTTTTSTTTTAVTEASAVPNGPSHKRNILEIASQLFKKTKLEQDLKKSESMLPKVPIPRLPHQRTEKSLPKMVPQTVASLHSTSLGLNYTVSVGQQSPSKIMKSNGTISPVKAESVAGMPESKQTVSPLNELKTVKTDFKVPSPSLGSPKLPEVSSFAKSPSPKHSPKSSPMVKHMYASTLQPPRSNTNIKPKPSMMKSTTSAPVSPKGSPHPISPTQNLSPSEILEKYNIQNLAQLTANFSLNPSVIASNQLAAFQHAMLLKHFELQNRQNWLNRNQGPLLQYEKYLQSLNGSVNGPQSQI